MARNFKELRARMDPERRKCVEARVQAALEAMPLEELRTARQLTQRQLAEVLHVSQGAVSKVERRADMYISTLRSYVQAVGGDLQIRAVFPEGDVLINQFEEIAGAVEEPGSRPKAAS
jgi:transcriptional regulator with XRE-family HTH domain